MKKHIVENLEIYKFEIFEKEKNLEHCFTTKNSGVSKDAFSSLNLGYNTEDSYENVVNNYNLVLDSIFGTKTMIRGIQTHSKNIKIINEKTVLQRNVYDDTDGFITNQNKIVLSTTYADCVPIFFYDKVKNIVGISHSGWKGTYKKIGKNMVESMVRSFGSSIEDIIVGIGPSIGENKYEVKEDMLERFTSIGLEDCFKKEDKKLFFDIKKANKQILLSIGIKNENIEISSNCTFTEKNDFYSYRRDNGNTGRMAGMIMLK